MPVGGYQIETYSRIEQAARDTVEDPDINHEREAEAQSYIRLGWNTNISGTLHSRDFSNCCASKCEEQEHGGADEFAQRGNDVYQKS